MWAGIKRRPPVILLSNDPTISNPAKDGGISTSKAIIVAIDRLERH